MSDELMYLVIDNEYKLHNGRMTLSDAYELTEILLYNNPHDIYYILKISEEHSAKCTIERKIYDPGILGESKQKNGVSQNSFFLRVVGINGKSFNANDLVNDVLENAIKLEACRKRIHHIYKVDLPTNYGDVYRTIGDLYDYLSNHVEQEGVQ